MIFKFTLLLSLLPILFLAHCLKRLVKQYAAYFIYPKRSYASSSPADYGLAYEDIFFHSSDGLRLEGWYVPARQPEKATIIFVHGLKGNRSSFLTQASTLIQEGYGALLFDLRNHGSSEGHITTMSAKEIFDIEGAVNFLKARAEVDPTNIGIIGHSFGASAALRAASQYRFKFVVAEAAFADLCDSMHQAARKLSGFRANHLLSRYALYPLVSLMILYAQQQAGHKAKTISPTQALATMAPCPCLFIHGLNDKMIAAEQSQQLFAVAKGNKELLLLENTGHSIAKMQRLSQAYVLDFVQKHGQSEKASSQSGRSSYQVPVSTTASGAYLL